MKINKSQLKEIIKEEIERTLNESEPVVKIPVSKMDDFKKRLEKWAMHYEKLSSWISNDAIIPARDEQLENPRQLSIITTKDGMKMRKQLYKLDNILATLMDDYEMQFKRYQDVRYDALKAIELDEEIIEEDGKGCADTDKGCIRKRKDGWVILNNKKGGVWRKCDSHSHCEEILDAFHASKG